MSDSDALWVFFIIVAAWWIASSIDSVAHAISELAKALREDEDNYT